MIVAVIGEDVIAIIRVYDGEKWCKIIREDGSVDRVRTADIAEQEI